MPEKPPTNRPIIHGAFGRSSAEPRPSRGTPVYAELLCASNFSFLNGASHPEELAAAAALLGLRGFSVTDRNTLSGIVRGHLAAKTTGAPYAVGCRLVFRDGTPDIAAWAPDRTAYGRLCRLLSAGNLRAQKGECHLDLADLLEWGEGLSLAIIPGRRVDPGIRSTLQALKEAFPGKVRLGATCLYRGDDARRLAALNAIARREAVPLLALGDVLYHAPERRRLQDVLSCIREHVTLDNAGRRLEANAERHLKPPEEMARLFRDHPAAIRETIVTFEELAFSLDELRYEYPVEATGESGTIFDELVRLTWAGAEWRYPEGVPSHVVEMIRHELKLIKELRYEPYFLTIRNIMEFARSRGILCQGRGSAANSAVCFCLRITEIDPKDGNLLFERFISAERGEPPDIDVDFEHERREEVIQHIYGKYGREYAGIAATVITYRSRSAAREVGKVFGLSDDALGALSGNVWGWSSTGIDGDDARRAGLDPNEARIAQILELSKEIIGFPRHLSQHVGGFIITRSRLDETVPILHSSMDGRTIIEWDKDDLDALGMFKIDVLALGMLTALKRGLDLLEKHYGIAYEAIAQIPEEEPEVYEMICRADTIGVFQIESRAQMTMLPRLRPREFYDLVIEVAIVRPGPIQGDMVHPYLKRRQNPKAVVYPKPGPPHDPDELKKVLEKTLGVPLFQEQAMRIAIVAAKFEPWEADKLRRAMATFRRVGTIHTFQTKMVEGMVARGYDRAFAERCFRQIEGFGEYGFPESHAASFALLVYASAWLKCRYPDIFCAALLNAQPMGFYAPAQLVRDAEDHGVEVREVDVNFSDWDATLEPLRPSPDAADPSPHGGRESSSSVRIHPRHATQTPAIRTSHAVRLGFRQIKGLRKDDLERLVLRRDTGYTSIRDIWVRSGLNRAALERLAEADAFRSMGLDRRAALWEVRALDVGYAGAGMPLFAKPDGTPDIEHDEPEFPLPAMGLGEHVVNDYRSLALSLKAHPVSFLRGELSARNIVEAGRLSEIRSGRRVSVAGLVLVRQRPGTAQGVIFATIEDETGVANIIVWPKVFERFRATLLGARFLSVTGQLQSEQGVIHVVAAKLEDLTPLLSRLSDDSFGQNGIARADEVRRPVDEHRQKVKPQSRITRMITAHPDLKADLQDVIRQTKAAMPKGRNFQ